MRKGRKRKSREKERKRINDKWRRVEEMRISEDNRRYGREGEK